MRSRYRQRLERTEPGIKENVVEKNSLSLFGSSSKSSWGLAFLCGARVLIWKQKMMTTMLKYGEYITAPIRWKNHRYPKKSHPVQRMNLPPYLPRRRKKIERWPPEEWKICVLKRFHRNLGREMQSEHHESGRKPEVVEISRVFGSNSEKIAKNWPKKPPKIGKNEISNKCAQNGRKSAEMAHFL